MLIWLSAGAAQQFELSLTAGSEHDIMASLVRAGSHHALWSSPDPARPLGTFVANMELPDRKLG